MAPNPSLPRSVLECLVSVEGTGAEVNVGIGAFGYIGASLVHRRQDVVCVKNIDGKVERAVLTAVAWAVSQWPDRDHVVICLPGSYLETRVDNAIKAAETGSGVERRLLGLITGKDGSIETDKVSNPSTPRMDEICAMAKSGQPVIDLTIEG